MSECKHRKGYDSSSCIICEIDALKKQVAELTAIKDDYEDLKIANKKLNERVVDLAIRSVANDATRKVFNNEFSKVVAERDELTARAEQAEKLLETLTPGGSEFHGDPERCAQWVRDRQESQHKALSKAVNGRKQAEGREKMLREALEPFAWFGERCKDFIPHPNSPDLWAIKTDRMKFVKAYEALAGDGEQP